MKQRQQGKLHGGGLGWPAARSAWQLIGVVVGVRRPGIAMPLVRRRPRGRGPTNGITRRRHVQRRLPTELGAYGCAILSAARSGTQRVGTARCVWARQIEGSEDADDAPERTPPDDTAGAVPRRSPGQGVPRWPDRGRRSETTGPRMIAGRDTCSSILQAPGWWKTRTTGGGGCFVDGSPFGRGTMIAVAIWCAAPAAVAAVATTPRGCRENSPS